MKLLIIMITFKYILSQCGPNTYKGPPGPQEYKKLLNHHNKVRSDAALGKLTYNGTTFPPAANMNELQWDDELANLAQYWAVDLAKRCQGMRHNPNRKVKNYDYVGENIYSFSSSGGNQPSFEDLYEKASIAWYNEIKDFSPSLVNKYEKSKPGVVVGHFSQLIWADTTYIGCGASAYSESWPYNYIIVCNYGEGGNYLDESTWITGKACSKCKSKCKSDNSGLCTGSKTMTVEAVDHDNRIQKQDAKLRRIR